MPSPNDTRTVVATSNPARRGRRSLRTGAVALVAAVALAGCQWTSTIQTDQVYEPADGTSVQVGALQVNNVVVVSQGNGAPGNVTGLAINNTGSPLQVTVGLANGGQAGGPGVTVPAGGTAPLSAPGGQAITVPVQEPAGSHVPLIISSGEGQTAVNAPVLAPEGYYAEYAPGGGAGTASPTEGSGEATATPGSSPTASPAPATPTGEPAPTEPASPTPTTAPVG